MGRRSASYARFTVLELLVNDRARRGALLVLL
jgi:hypothetical protein